MISAKEALPNPDRLEAYLEDMRLLDPDYDLPLVDFWDPAIVHHLESVERLQEQPVRFRARIGSYAVIYSAGRAIPVQLEILDAVSGRRLRQDGEDDSDILDLLSARWNEENT